MCAVACLSDTRRTSAPGQRYAMTLLRTYSRFGSHSAPSTVTTCGWDGRVGSCQAAAAEVRGHSAAVFMSFTPYARASEHGAGHSRLTPAGSRRLHWARRPSSSSPRNAPLHSASMYRARVTPQAPARSYVQRLLRCARTTPVPTGACTYEMMGQGRVTLQSARRCWRRSVRCQLCR